MWNKIAGLMVILIASTFLFTPIEIEGRGGRGGGRSGGAYRGGHTMNRTPTMSRASQRPTTSQARPAVSKGRVQQKPTASNRAELRNQVNRYAESRPAGTVDRQALGQKAQNISSNRTQQIAQNRQLSDRASQRLQQSRPDSKQWFDRNFFDRHNLDVDYVGRGANLWRPAAWGALATWGAWNWSTPYYYDGEGYTYPVTSTESSAYSTTTTMQTQPFVSSATTQEDWLPLGVFAIANNANAAVYTHRYMQLAINRSGEIAGVFYNSTTDVAQDLTGKVDPTTQKAYWSLSNRTNSPIATTGIYNLTEDQTPINVHFGDGVDQTWTLVRLKQEQ